MRRKLLVILAVFWLLICFGLFLVLGKTDMPRAQALALVIATPTSTLSTQSSSGGDATVIAAVISAIGALVAALIAGVFVTYQIRRTAKLERERIQLQAELEASRVTKERKEKAEENARDAMLRAQTRVERADAYRKSIHTDPRIASLQILDMSQPIEISRVYVRLRVHQETKLGFELDPVLVAAERLGDPNELLQADRMLLESRIRTALGPVEAISKFTRCVVVGDPGAGKTTLLKYLALKSVDQKQTELPKLPIYIELNAFASSGYQDLLDYASTKWDERYGFPKTDGRSYMEESLSTGKALLLLDALDETFIGDVDVDAKASYSRTANAIMQLATHYPKSPIVVTARKAGYQQGTLLTGFTTLDVLDFRPEDIEQFVNNWFTYS